MVGKWDDGGGGGVKSRTAREPATTPTFCGDTDGLQIVDAEDRVFNLFIELRSFYGSDRYTEKSDLSRWHH